MDQQNNARDRVYRFLDGVSQDENVATMVRMMIHTGEWQALTDYARKLGFPDSLDAEELRAHTDPENIIDNFVAFKNRCIAKEELRDKLEALAQGDFAGIARIAQDEGLSLTEEEVRRNIPKAFYKGMGQNPDEGWDPELA